ncbi:28S ribosomal protein S35, mitochondrial-like isoform X2 [Uloborus diversus]|uniref:28S ribosomal protein S35, mitochondrial-like isoform X2 n=1 Tax=Uloborus diversus TaxID=327109 RepID=UPI002408F783|nr:28S ribosomal protein S35, mitochondrial-like isoform X2 [Uloborus diversus]
MKLLVAPPRETRMPIDQDWPSVWPTAKTFRPSVVPLPVYQGYDQKRAPPGKYANAELMKIPNFLHLTPPAIKRHCAAIKKFCTEWPKGLETEEDYDKHFPVEIITSDYCHSSPTIRDERSRIVTLKVKMKSLKLDYHGRDKLLRLIGNDRYHKGSDIITIISDRCPLRKQNYDYSIYLLTALHHESWVTEPWEHEKTEADMEKFFFENSRIQKHITETVMKIKSTSNEEKALAPMEIEKSQEVIEYGDAVTKLINEGEDETTIMDYKKSVLKALGLQA